MGHLVPAHQPEATALSRHLKGLPLYLLLPFPHKQSGVGEGSGRWSGGEGYVGAPCCDWSWLSLSTCWGPLQAFAACGHVPRGPEKRE